MNTIMLKAHDVYKSIDSKNGIIDILKGVDLQVHKGESVAIVGQSGSGKSTLLSLLAGLDIPQKGQIHISDIEISTLNEDKRAHVRMKNSGFVFQSFYLMEDLTALENVALPLELFGHYSPEKAALKELEKLGLKQRSHHFPKQLSGGEQQRVALARAFVINPKILFADEPTANLDVNTAQHVIELLFELHKKSQNSLVLVTHDQKLASRCDTIYYLENGILNYG